MVFSYISRAPNNADAIAASDCANQAHFGDPMTLQAEFDQAQADSKNLPERPDNMTLLKIYALFKQASAGDAEGDRPGMTDFVGRAKWDAWDAIRGTSKEDAMRQYIDLINELKQ
jgi:diazepam-binding inhibitor (GABA receptor modulating acyl-CoA-binding protein)